MHFDFETSRLSLRPYGSEDWPHAHRILSDPRIIWWRKNNPMSEAETHSFIDKYAGAEGTEATGFGWWLVFDKLNGETPQGLAGHVALNPLPERPELMEIGWHFLVEGRGKGYATEAARRLLRHGFETMGLAEIVAVIVPANTTSSKVAERLRMTKIDQLMKAGLLHHLFRIGCEEWSTLE